MEKHILSKSTFIRGTQCLKSLYLNKKRYFLRDRMSTAQRAVFQRGTDVGILAQQLFPGGIDLKPRSPSVYRKKARETMEAIAGNRYSVLYEATFQHNRLLAILDILVKNGNYWTAYEVKSSLKISETFLLDAAFQYYVITRSGIPLNDFYLVYVNGDYVFEDKPDIQRLFVRQSVLQEVMNRQPFVEKQIEKEKMALEATSSPPVDIGPWCNHPYPCDFRGHCWKKVRENSLLYLDAFTEDERFEKYYNGHDDPEKTEMEGLTVRQKHQITSAIRKEAVFDRKKLAEFVHIHLKTPVFFTLFAIRPAVPFVRGAHPYDVYPLAAAYQKPSGNITTRFFQETTDLFSDFSDFIREIMTDGKTLVTYDITPLMELLYRWDEALARQAEKQMAGLKPLLTDTTVFHYLLKGNYAAPSAARVFLGETGNIPDSALLEMKWQKEALGQNSVPEFIKKQTEELLIWETDFIKRFSNYLINNSE